MAFRPLSKRDHPDPAYDGPHDGIPAWMFQSVARWVDARIYGGTGHARKPNERLLLDAEAVLRVTFNWSQKSFSARSSMLTRMANDGEFGLDFLDFLLAKVSAAIIAAELDDILIQAGSAWEVRKADPPRGYELVRRTIGPLADAIEDIRPVSARAHAHLTTAWSKLMGRNPDPSGAYREAIRAVEVVAAPVVTPNDSLPTLGKIIKAICDKPDKWTVDLAEATPEQVADMASMIWQSQLDRHGTHDENVPLNVSQAQADAAVHIAIALTRMFAGGHITAV